MHEKAINYYKWLSSKIISPLEIRNKSLDTSLLDEAYLLKILDKNKKILDLGSGTGLLVNKLLKQGFYIDAVEYYVEFAKFIDSNIRVHLGDISNYEPEQKYDYITAFGIFNFFSSEEIVDIYKKVYSWISPDGMLVIKQQMGLGHDVLVDGFSSELGVEYYSTYRNVDHELKLLTEVGFKIIGVDDIYPDEFNRWPNTRFYAIKARRPDF